MSSLREPVGPESKKVYLRRRLAALAVLLAVIVAVVLVVVRMSSAGDDGAKPTPKPSVPAEVAETPKPAANGKNPACAPGALQVEAITDQGSYPEGQEPQFSLSVLNTGDAACTIDAGTAQMVFTVTSGAEQYWRSTDCQTEGASLPVILKPKVPLVTAPLGWERVRSTPDTCEEERDEAPGGGASYHLKVSLGGVEGRESAQFILN